MNVGGCAHVLRERCRGIRFEKVDAECLVAVFLPFLAVIPDAPVVVLLRQWLGAQFLRSDMTGVDPCEGERTLWPCVF